MQEVVIKVVDLVLPLAFEQLRVIVQVMLKQMILLRKKEKIPVVWLLVRMPIQDLIRIILPLTVQLRLVLVQG